MNRQTDTWFEITWQDTGLARVRVTLSPLSGNCLKLEHGPPEYGFQFSLAQHEARGLALSLAKAAGGDVEERAARIIGQAAPPPPAGLHKRVADLERLLLGETREP